jgi:hypothetical protein
MIACASPVSGDRREESELFFGFVYLLLVVIILDQVVG